MADLISQQGLYQDGNSIFENVHILGTLNVSGIVTSTTTITASKFIGDGSELSGIDATTIKDSTGTTQIQGTTTGATHSGRAVFNEIEISGKLYDADGDFGTSGQVLASDGTNTDWVNTGSLTAGAASEVGVTAVSTNSDHFLTFVSSSSGNENIEVDTDLKYNPSTNTLGSINIASAVITGNLQIDGQLKDGDGNFGGAGTVLTSDGTDTKWDNVGNLAAGSAAKVSVSEDDTQTDGRILFSNAAGQSGGNVVKSDNDLTYNANTNTLTVTTLSGTATQAANLDNHDTNDLSEGSSNLYFTETRSRTAISVTAAGTPSGAGSLSYDNNTGQFTFTPAAAAGEPTTISVNDESSDTTCFPLFGTAATGSIAPKTGSNLTFNSADGTLAASEFSGGGAGLTSLNADNLGTGSLPSARLVGPYANTVTIGSVRIGAWTGDNAYKGIYHTSQGGAAYMIMSNNTATFISASPSQPVRIRYGANNGTDELYVGTGINGLTWRGSKIFHAGNDGSGSTLDADTLDGVQGASFLRSDADDTFSGKLTNASRNEDPSHDRGVILIQPSVSGGRTGINFRSNVNSTSDHGYLWWYDDNNNYRINNSTENGSLVLGVQNDASNATTSDSVAIESSGDIFLNPGLSDNSYGGASGPNFTRGKVYVGRASARYEVYHTNNLPTIPTNNNQLTNGAGYVTTGFSRTIVRAYGSNTTYTPTSGTKSIIVYCIAGGGGGGNASGDDSGEQSDFGAASGGGGGGCAIGHYQLTGSFSASIQIGGGGGGSSGGGESRFTPSGSYTGNGTIQGNGGSGAGSNSAYGAGGGGAGGGFNLTGHQGNNRSTSSSGGQYYQTPGNGGVAGFVFGTFGSGGNGGGPTGGSQGGQSGTAGVVVVYEYIQ